MISDDFFSHMREYYADLEDKIAAEGRLGGFTTHSADIGSNREQILIDILNAHLPRRLKAIKGGVIVNLDGQVSNQIDIIVVHDGFPAFGAVAKPFVIREAVLGVIEVKSNLTTTDTEDNQGELLNAIENVASVPPITEGALVATPGTFAEIREKLPIRVVYAYTCGDQRTVHNKASDSLNSKNLADQSKFPDIIAVNHKVSITRSAVHGDSKLIATDIKANTALRGMPIGIILSALVDTTTFLPHMDVTVKAYANKAFMTGNQPVE